MYITNITFICPTEDTKKHIDAIRKFYIPDLMVRPMKEAKLMRLSNVFGGANSENQPVSLALQVAFDTNHDRDVWNKLVLLPLLEAYQDRYGENGLAFVTTLDTIENFKVK
ncbi:MAG: DUF4286 family protein [Prevotella sp.]|nr:DUF4286 family protein [Bacteroides sp.]MCM1366275.1 DUF4286 family protein [Prevotella sp.]MCM1436321.1 DUF4286 family protein [Prevotella sp.]